MIPSDIRLYTWLDAEEVILRLQEENNLPHWLVWVQAYWDSLTIGIRPGTQAEAKEWLQQVYDPRFQKSTEDERVDGLIILESLPNKQQLLPVILEETEEGRFVSRRVPSLARPRVIVSNHENGELPPSFTEDFPSIVAFHSFKGGVGRTTNALAFAQALTEEGYSVLLVDGDMEAPGISWLLEQRLPSPPVAFADLIALVHGDPDPEATDSIQLVANRLQSAFIDNIYILPAFRSIKIFSSLEIRPEHLIQGAKNPFILTQILADLGRVLNVDVVLVDLRAGLSELSTGLILDPRVYRVFVTTLSGQSISGTARLLELIAEKAPSSQSTEPLPTIIISQVPDELIKEPDSFSLENKEIKLLEYAKLSLGEDLDLRTRFDDNLRVLPSNWEEVITKLKRSGIIDSVRPLVDLLPKRSSKNAESSSVTLKNSRETLKDFTKKQIVAETAESNDFLSTIPLRHLALDNRHQVPITVVVGAKGSGKTYTFLQIIRRENWESFAQDACATPVHISALICPVLAPLNSQPILELARQVLQKTSKALGFNKPLEIDKIRDYIRNSYHLNLHEGQWRERWLDVIAWSVGFKPEEEGAGRALADHLFYTQQRLLVIIDGLEDLFQNFTNEENQKTALRALLQEVPEWLGLLPGRPLGILIFVRRDMVLAAVRQNAAQMIARYEPYALKWNREEALRLVAWITMQSKIALETDIEKLHDMKEEELTQVLIPLWGKKLGSDTSKEAASARFVLAALSDFRGQIQSRDLVRLLHLAAKASVDDTKWQDRILVPPGIKGALRECSIEKIKEIELENTALKDVFTKLRDLYEEERKIPFTREQLRLSIEEMKILEENGVIIREKDDYYMPEIFRLGLNFSLTAVGRPAIMYLARRAARQGS
ncbi:KGGVGR-motif variant AAA ATPase [Anabaena azotica]|uniref:AAA family ATPase n=1 Tax=Anabaena azotica FACHB-119 TaxID=947527 RepID=A0ABR8D983_9NOST|nr:AAA family ATPase [Anabaena azotica]MBD2503209.1 AAA family ATPase [Anabaena azotica FACHB-119]